MGKIDENVINEIVSKISEEDSEKHIDIQEKVDLVKYLYEWIKESVNEEAEVTSKINKPFKSMASISVRGSDIIFDSTEALTAASASASNVEIYPRLDGTVVMNFTFHGISKKVR